MVHNIYYCITCYNRFWQLKQTLLNNINETVKASDDNCYFILVDFNGDDSEQIKEHILSDELKKHIDNGKLKYYRREPQNGNKFIWNVSIAKSVSHRLAIMDAKKNNPTNFGDDILVNLDGDNFIQSTDNKRIRSVFEEKKGDVTLHMSEYNRNTVIFLRKYKVNVENKYNKPAKNEIGDVGRVAMTIEKYILSGGYDEQFSFMGYQETDLIIRLALLGCKYIHINLYDKKFRTNIPNGKPTIKNFVNRWWASFRKNKAISHKNIMNKKLTANTSGYIESLDKYEHICNM